MSLNPMPRDSDWAMKQQQSDNCFSTWSGPTSTDPPSSWDTDSPPPWDTPTGWDKPTSWDIPYPPTDYADKVIDLDLSQRLAAKLLMVAPDGLNDDTLDQESSNNPRFKTEICRNYKEKGSCVYSDNCQFAHGRDELRMRDRNMNVTQDVVRHNKYKTKLCQKYWIAGYCAYGPRCNFIHNESERVDTDIPSYVPQHHVVPNNRMIMSDWDRKNSAGDSGDSGSECRTPSLSPPAVVNPMTYHKPVYGSGRLAAHAHNDIFTWVDTWTQKYL